MQFMFKRLTVIMANLYVTTAIILLISTLAVSGQDTSSTPYTTSVEYTTPPQDTTTPPWDITTTEWQDTTTPPWDITTTEWQDTTTPRPDTTTPPQDTTTTEWQDTTTTEWQDTTTTEWQDTTMSYPATTSYPPELCCNYEYDTCNLIYTEWKWSAQYSPTPYSVPSYDGRFMWTNEVNSQIWTPTITVTPVTIYSFAYYMETSSNKFYVKFRRASDGSVISISSTSYYGSWEVLTINFANCAGCCDGLTCDGQLMITIDGSDTSFVAAIDDFGRDNTCTPQYSTAPTLPPPISHPCCLFESDICDYTLFSWKWSAQYNPSYSVPAYSGDYLWTSTLDSEVVSITQSVEYATHFQFSYYLSSSSNYVYLYFREAASGDLNEITYYSYTSGGWRNVDIQCYYDCCDSYPCEGQLFFVITGTSSSFVAAIDSIGRDYSCEEELPCCQFNDNTICNFDTTNVDGYYWKSYVNYNPSNDPPYPGSSYVFFETVNYGGSQTLNVILESPTITINYNSVFTGNIYAKDQSQQSSDTSLLVSFYNDKTGESTQLDYVKDTSGSWKNIAFYCESTHGNCCPDDQCTGKLQVTAKVGSYGGSVLYGVDAFEIDSACTNFPDSDVTDSYYLLQPKKSARVLAGPPMLNLLYN